jgi:hypothetical protein
MIAVGAPYGQRLTGPVSLQCETSSPLIDCSLSSDSPALPNDPTLVATSLLSITARPQVGVVSLPSSSLLECRCAGAADS